MYELATKECKCGYIMEPYPESLYYWYGASRIPQHRVRAVVFGIQTYLLIDSTLNSANQWPYFSAAQYTDMV
jgi:hypothetical protein